MPRCIGCIISRASLETLIKHRRENDADRVSSWIAARVSECADLLEVNVAESSLFEELARGGMLEGFVLVDEATRESPPTFKWLLGALDEQHFNLTSSAAKQYNVYSDRGTRILVAVDFRGLGFDTLHRSPLSLSS
jgi:hypothetical protein